MNRILGYCTDIIELKKLMIECNLETNLALSEASGVDRNTIGKITSGKEQPSALNMYRIALALHMSPDKAGSVFFKPILRNA